MMTSPPLPQTDLFGMVLDFPTSSSARRRARISAAQTPKVKVSTASAPASTSKPSASLTNAGLVGSLLKIALISELEAQTGSSMRWRQSATPAGHSWLVLETSVQTTSASEVGLSDSRLPTPMASDGMQDGKGGGAGSTYPFRMILATPRASDMRAGGHGDTGRMGTVRHILHESYLPTPRASEAHHGPDMTSHSPNIKARMANNDPRWQGARALAALLQSHGLTGTAALPITYGWMMGYPAGWLSRALRSAVQEGRLRQVSSLKPSAMRSSRKSLKQSVAQSCE